MAIEAERVSLGVDRCRSSLKLRHHFCLTGPIVNYEGQQLYFQFRSGGDRLTPTISRIIDSGQKNVMRYFVLVAFFLFYIPICRTE